MIRRLLVELLLFLTPFAIFFVYRAASRTMSVRDRWPLTRLVLAGGVLASLGLILPPLFSPSAGDKCYFPPRYVNGVETPGGMYPCTEVEVSDEPLRPAEAPVAPRDRKADR